jgi:ankyrin repeat protein
MSNNNKNLQRELPTATEGLTLRSAPPVKQGATLINRFFGGRKKRFFEAIKSGDLPLVRALIERGVDIRSAKTVYGQTPLVVAVSYSGNLDIVRELLARGADVNGVYSEHGETPLMAACNGLLYDHGTYFDEDNLEIVRELLRRGALVNAAQTDGFTALMIASDGGYLQIVRELLAHGADVNAQMDNGKTPLMFACGNGHLEVVRELLGQGANVNAVETIDGRTPLIVAAYWIRFKENYGFPEFSGREKNEKIEEFKNNSVELLKLLCQNGADPNIIDTNEMKAIDYIDNPNIKNFLMEGCDNTQAAAGVSATVAPQGGSRRRQRTKKRKHRSKRRSRVRK